MRNRYTQRHLRLLHTLVLFGVLCVLGIQTLEAQHHHAPDETVSACLLCQASTATAASPAAQPLIAPAINAYAPACADTAPARRVHSPCTARGPPAIS